MQDSLAKRGLAIIVTCNGAKPQNLRKLSSPDFDGTTMKEALDDIGFHTHLIQNETKPMVSSCLRDIASCLYKYKEKENKVIIFVFSGHGTTGDQICFEDYDDRYGTGTINLPDIISYFVSDDTLTTPKLFLIDACRGITNLREESKSVPDDQGKKWIGRKSNYRIDYATIDDHETYGYQNGGSRWLSAVARKLRDQSSSFQDIMADVQEEVWKNKSLNKQQPHTHDRLHCGRLYMYLGQ